MGQPGMPGMPGQPGAVGSPGFVPPNAGDSLPNLAEMDQSIVCNPNFLRATASLVLKSKTLAAAAKVPMGVICHPMAGDTHDGNPDIKVVDFGKAGIVRCKKCRTYINPYVTWHDNGRKWKCNICGLLNDVPDEYYSHLNQDGHRRDRDKRPELTDCSVEFVAPTDYMVRAPVPPVYFFVIDVSTTAAQSGMLQSMVNAIKASLDTLPGGPRTQIGFITFDTCVHYYNLHANLSAPQMHVVSDINDIILPLPEDLLVNLQDSRKVVDSLLDSLPSMFANNQAILNCTGPAILAAFRIINDVGGKMLLFQTSLPTMGLGALKSRENPRLLNTDKEHQLLIAEDKWYSERAIEFSAKQVCVDTFLFSGQYTDVATLSVLSKYTGGAVYYYPNFNSSHMGEKFEAELKRTLTRPTGFESVMRVRASRGLRITSFYGNYYVRGTDLLALPNCTADSCFGFDMTYDDPVLIGDAMTVQAALLYTTSDGERRIRVHTMLMPVTENFSQYMDTVDISCTVNLVCKQATDIATKVGFRQARDKVHQLTLDILRASEQAKRQPGATATDHESLALLPLYSISLQKSIALRGGMDVRIDERAFYMNLCANMTIEESKNFIYPRLFSIHDMPDTAGIPAENPEEIVGVAGSDNICLPDLRPLTNTTLTDDGVYLLENAHDLFLYIGRGVSSSIISTLFGVESVNEVDVTTLALQRENSDFSARFGAVLDALRSERARFMHMHIIREVDPNAVAYFSRYLVDDAANFVGGATTYKDYYEMVRSQVGAR
jgi:protein transport protein SEC24